MFVLMLCSVKANVLMIKLQILHFIDSECSRKNLALLVQDGDKVTLIYEDGILLTCPIYLILHYIFSYH